LWFYSCVWLENVDPLEGGYLRRKYRKDRRPTMPVESALAFYPRYAAELATKFGKQLGMLWWILRFQRKLQKDRNARNYMDAAPTPTQIEETAPESHELLPIVGAGARN